MAPEAKIAQVSSENQIFDGPPPFKFWIGTQVQIGERKHAMQNRRLQEDDFVMKCIRQIVQVWPSLRMCAM